MSQTELHIGTLVEIKFDTSLEEKCKEICLELNLTLDNSYNSYKELLRQK
jgi:hypothetical protein